MGEIIRILHVFARMDRGGAESMIMNIYRNIDRSKVQFDFMVHTEEQCEFDEEIIKLGGKIFRVSRYNGKNHFSYKAEWSEFFKKHLEHTIIHGHVRSTASIYLKQAKLYNRIAIAHSHNTSSGKGVKAIVKNLYQFRIRYNSDYMFACSQNAGRWLFGKNAIKTNRFMILRNAIQTDCFKFNEDIRNELRKEMNLEGKFVVGHVGRFHPQKNHEFVIDVFNILKSKKDNAILILIGDGKYKRNIQNKVRDLGLNDSVIFLGVRADVNNLFQVMDVFLFPSKYEGLGIVIIEAQAAGLQCMISENIPNEATVTDLVTKLPLSMKQQNWVNSILNKTIKKIDRRNYYKLVKDSGYDVETTSVQLLDFYLSISHNLLKEV